MISLVKAAQEIGPFFFGDYMLHRFQMEFYLSQSLQRLMNKFCNRFIAGKYIATDSQIKKCATVANRYILLFSVLQVALKSLFNLQNQREK